MLGFLLKPLEENHLGPRTLNRQFKVPMDYKFFTFGLTDGGYNVLANEPVSGRPYLYVDVTFIISNEILVIDLLLIGAVDRDLHLLSRI